MSASTLTGPLYDPLFHTPSAELYDIYAHLREDHPVYRSEERGAWCLSRHEDVLDAARGWAVYSNAEGVDLDVPAQYFGEGDFLDTDPPIHDRLRDVVRRHFAPTRVALLASTVERHVEGLLAGIAGRREVDLARELAWQVPIVMIAHVLGIPEQDRAELQDSVFTVMHRRPGESDVPEVARAALRRVQESLRALAEEKRRRPEDDVLSSMAAAVASGDMRREELVGMGVLLLIAGSDTTASLMTNVLHLLFEHPDERGLVVRGEVEIERVIEEALRFESPIQYLARTTTEDVELHGTRITRGERVLLLYGAANRDSRRFPDGDRFDVRREPKRHVAFGNGIHFCLGAPLARLEARIALRRVLDAMKSYELTGCERFQTHNLRGFSSLPARIEWRGEAADRRRS